MKKIIFTLLALVGTMSMNAQILKVMKGDKVVATFTAEEADNFVFEEASAAPIFPFGQGEAAAKDIGNVRWIQLWENGPKFAEYNVGVTDGKAESFGGYYTWADNIATTQWGEKWRMPTRAEFDALLNNQNCTCTWTTQNGVKGLLCKGKENTDYSSNSVFLPAAGNCYDGNVSGQGSLGSCWSSTPNDRYGAYSLNFDSARQGVNDSDRNYGYSVRAVLNE